MGRMNDTPVTETNPNPTGVDDAIEQLADVDPAEAPELAERIAGKLAGDLDPPVDGTTEGPAAMPAS